MQAVHTLGKLDDPDCPSETHRRGFTCEECGENFQKPILARVSASGQTQTYYACPRCIKEVQHVERTARRSEQKTATPAEPARRRMESASSVRCGHFFGYLNKHKKDMPYPDECLTCDKMVECMLR
jgi:hypothetical protein